MEFSSSHEAAALTAGRLYALLADTSCRVFDETSEPNGPPDEKEIQERLTGPLQWLLCGGDPSRVFAGLEEQKTPSNFCGKVFKSGEPAYFCKECQTDPTCCLCMECFNNSEHKGHRYKFFASGGGGCCDCGDPEAWTSGVHCDLHRPSQHSEQEADPVEHLPPSFVERGCVFFSTVLRYCMDVLVAQSPRAMPARLHLTHTAQCLLEDKFLTFLYNDEIHSYDEVVYTLTHNGKSTHTEAVALATVVDRKGRAVIRAGTETDCCELKEVIDTDTADKPLTVHVFHSAVVAHQSCALHCLNLLKELAEKSAAFRRLISTALVQKAGASTSVLDECFLNDSKLWITARLSWHRLIMASIFLDPLYKSQLGLTLTRNYCAMQKNFLADSHHHDVCITNLSVQLFTAPTLSRMLVAEHGLLKVLLDTVMEVLQRFKDPSSGALKLRSQQQTTLSRLVYVMYDLRYVLRNKPESWNDHLRAEVKKAFSVLLELLGMLQNADPVKRQRGRHVLAEDPWEYCFNISISLQPAIFMLVDWCTSDRTLLIQAARLTLLKHRERGNWTNMRFKPHNVDRELVGQKTVQLIVFDILKEFVSVHQPLSRVLACLLMGAHKHNLSLTQVLQIQPTDSQTLLFLLEHASRVLVMAVQVLAGMWKRNGYSVVNQILNYQFHYSRDFMFDRDIVMLQAMAAVVEPNVFVYALIYKFRLEDWLMCPDSDPVKRGEPADDALRFFISEAEEFLFLLTAIFAERYQEGVGVGVTAVDGLRREIIHRLYISPLSHSEIIKQFRLSENEKDIDEILKQVATLKRSGPGGGKSVFELKKDYEEEYNPFFYHYSRVDHSKAEDAHRRRIKASGGQAKVKPAPPRAPPHFTEPFAAVMRLTRSSVLQRVLHCIIKRAASPDSNCWSDRLLHETLHVLAVMLSDEAASEPASLCNAAIGRHENNAFLDDLESLLQNRRAEEHRPLLAWIVQYLRRAQEGGLSVMEVEPLVLVAPPSPAQAPPSPAAVRRRQRAQMHRDKLMNQISSMQKKFLSEHKQELDEVDFGGAALAGGSSGGGVTQHCAVGVASPDHAPPPVEVTCILCQETAGDVAAQAKLFVQAVHVQRSAVLRTSSSSSPPLNLGSAVKLDTLNAGANFSVGMYTSGCGHQMHALCWTSFIESKQREHTRNTFFPLPGHSVLWGNGEFLCPLCQSFSNTVLPLLLPLPAPRSPSPTPPPPSSSSSQPLSFPQWRELVAMATDLADSDIKEQESSVDPTFLDRLQELFPTYSKPTSYPTFAIERQDKTKVLTLLSQAVYRIAYSAESSEDDERVCLAQWNNCAYTITGLEYNARAQDKFLLESLSPRQVNSVRSLVLLGVEAKVRPPTRTLAKYLRHLCSMFLLDSTASPELPCLLEVDCFSMLVNLHFVLGSLYPDLTRGRGSQLSACPVATALLGLSDQFLVAVTTAALTLQYLLTCPPAMELEDRGAADGPEGADLASGVVLQELWHKYRALAKLPADTAPSAYELYAGLQSHLYPFLHRAALFFHCHSAVTFIHSSASIASRFEDLCHFLGLPVAVHTLFAPALGESYSIPLLAQLWCQHPRLAELVSVTPTPAILLEPRRLVDLPANYSDLVKMASDFKCPKRQSEENMTDDGQAAMLCLVCGQMLCANSYCCQAQSPQEDGGKQLRLGGFTQHAQTCGAGMGVALWILECYVVLLNATDLSNVKGCTVTPPYLDEYGETDPGLRRGNPLLYNEADYQELKELWYQHRVADKICTDIEANRGLMRISWAKM